ncbi:anchored repeat-type ABC transporter ATP-binding subunit [Rothia sp. P7208]|uniref:anchored repeat-type ABC transporter ATP-binding subunit n=1 Tax=Rothia sp. P7208 TaxID=3402660 RepID=UPI003AC63C3E
MRYSFTSSIQDSAVQTPLVLAQDVRVHYGHREIISGLDMKVSPGEFIALVGANGAGKTTLLRTLMGLISPSSGTVSILGRSPIAAREKIGYVPQKHYFEWSFPITVKDAVLTGRTRAIGWFRRPSTDDWVSVFRAIERSGITHLQDRVVGELSGGQRQRVLLARALASDPSLLLLDEPFTGVDAPTQDSLNELYTSLAEEGLGIVMSTHDMLSALTHCSRICGVRGNLALDAPAHQLSVEELHRWLREA